LVSGTLLIFLPVLVVRLGGSNLLVGLLSSGPALAAIVTMWPAAVLVERWRASMRFLTWIVLLTRLFYLPVTLAPGLAGEHSAE